jgi:predicted transposase YbfD/YdcC
LIVERREKPGQSHEKFTEDYRVCSVVQGKGVANNLFRMDGNPFLHGGEIMSLPFGINALICLESLVDPRVHRNLRHKLVDILLIALCGFMAGCEGWVDVELFGISKQKWFEKFLELPNGIPSHDTFGRVFALIDPQQLTRVLQEFVQAVMGSLQGAAIAIDGKTLARSGEKLTGKEALHLVSAWATERGLVLGQVATAQHSNEITAIPALLRVLDVRGATVTIDALGCQQAIARQVREQGADYVLAVKGNQKKLQEVVQFQLGRGQSRVSRSKLRTREKNHGRTERRLYTAMAASTAVRRHWPDAQSIVRVCRQTTGQGPKTKEVRDFVSSLPPQVERLAALVRGHWGIENQLHWSLDVTFNEDQSRIRQGHAAENAGLLRRLALSILKQDTWYSNSLRGKRLRAGWESSALQHFLMIFAGN